MYMSHSAVLFLACFKFNEPNLLWGYHNCSWQYDFTIKSSLKYPCFYLLLKKLWYWYVGDNAYISNDTLPSSPFPQHLSSLYPPGQRVIQLLHCHWCLIDGQVWEAGVTSKCSQRSSCFKALALRWNGHQFFADNIFHSIFWYNKVLYIHSKSIES